MSEKEQNSEQNSELNSEKNSEKNSDQKTKDKGHTKNIEEMLSEVDEIILSLENGDIALEDSFKIYEKGMKMIRSINSRIDKVEKEIIKIDAKEQESNEA